MAHLQWRQMLRVTGIGGLFSFTAGYTNVLLLSSTYSASAVCHMTGTTTNLALAVSRLAAGANGTAPGSGSGDRDDPWAPGPADFDGSVEIVLLAGFLLGAGAAGLLVGPSLQHRLRVASRYGAGLVLESVLLALALAMTYADRLGAVLFAAMAMGLQNGMTTIYSGALLRSTHVTGVWTDIGVLIGQYIHQAGHRIFGDPESRILVNTEIWRLRFLVPIMLGFIAGATLGGLSYIGFGKAAFAIPILITAVSGSAVIAYNARKHWLVTRTVQKRVYESLRTRERARSRGNSSAGDRPDARLRDGDDDADGADGSDFARPEMTANVSLPSQPVLDALTARGDWDALAHTMQIRNAARQLASHHPEVATTATHDYQVPRPRGSSTTGGDAAW
eukprot:Unigene9890_Nuclearia_a/m.30194 Unigene9890_Nuclearia_a/g.30194  ORF Unigene9890_Nuclearia_a/g.30194 Unigene9890_Nuclearia_a/m.30194 type:complete len:391 (-) Unigene9890_Nuclearia_a:44-1216(-)